MKARATARESAGPIRSARRRAWRLAACGAPLVLALLAGCRQYEIVVTINPDGSGSRALRLQADPTDFEEEESTLEEFIALFSLGPDSGWTLARKSEQEGKSEILVFSRDSAPGSPEAWERQGGDVNIQGTRDPGRHARVTFANELSVELVSGPGPRTCTYRERFAWTGLREILTGRQAEGFFARLRGSYPYLKDEDRLELTGLLAGAILATVELEASAGEREGMAEALARAVEAHAGDVIRRHDPSAACEDLAQITREAITGADQNLEAFLRRELPGAYLAGATSITLRVTMSGLIVDSNADRVEGKTATWTFDVWDALVCPVEVFVRAEISG